MPELTDLTDDPLIKELQSKLRALEGVKVPFPDKTPFDSDAKIRRAYLDAYEKGYRFGLTGFFNSCVLRAGSSPAAIAESKGFWDGQIAGNEQYRKNGSEREVTGKTE